MVNDVITYAGVVGTFTNSPLSTVFYYLFLEVQQELCFCWHLTAVFRQTLISVNLSFNGTMW